VLSVPPFSLPHSRLPPCTHLRFTDWNDIAGQRTAKDLIQEVVVWPIKNPQLFTVNTHAAA
jgi:SpoVK/Ycf46/Vps4 family AAA+-type ATPase